MFSRIVAAIAATALALLSACGSQSTSDNTSSSADTQTSPVALEHYEDASGLPAGTTVVFSATLEMFDIGEKGVATLCLDSSDSDLPTCFEDRFIARNVPFNDIPWKEELIQQRPEYRYAYVDLTGTLVYPGVIEVSEISPAAS
ncbi:hypothetical protein [Actinobaculum sp. 313]|uniref:hypothetical protein n=1 Tax=Actinobaculum sp. 313 TaxID=2495645 RepID=UPI000D52938B|nr:hypothetical protein [Actinobaculum sp. 313]AWE41828.1 hypothetical protein DDD63_02585 [Actinobaculum sp. 313]